MAKKKEKSSIAAFQAAAKARGLTYAQAQVEETAAMVKKEMDISITKVKMRIIKEQQDKKKRGRKCKQD